MLGLPFGVTDSPTSLCTSHSHPGMKKTTKEVINNKWRSNLTQPGYGEHGLAYIWKKETKKGKASFGK